MQEILKFRRIYINQKRSKKKKSRNFFNLFLSTILEFFSDLLAKLVKLVYRALFRYPLIKSLIKIIFDFISIIVPERTLIDFVLKKKSTNKFGFLPVGVIKLLLACFITYLTVQSHFFKAHKIFRIYSLMFPTNLSSSRFLDLGVQAFLTLCLMTRNYGEVVKRFGKKPTGKKSFDLIVASCLLRDLLPEKALQFFGQYSIPKLASSQLIDIALCYELLGNRSKSFQFLAHAFNKQERVICSHQNYAARYSSLSYKAVNFEREAPERHMLYDQLNRLAEDIFLSGEFEKSMKIYKATSDYQIKNRHHFPIPGTIKSKLAENYKFDKSKHTFILSVEWVTQFGHIGLLNAFLIMRNFGFYEDGNYVLLAPVDKVSNRTYLKLWEKYFTIIHDKTLIRELYPYQRYWGISFQFWRCPATHSVCNWTEKAAEAMRMHQGQTYQPPYVSISDATLTACERKLSSQRINPEGRWIVSIHAREGGFYNEKVNGLSYHRSSDISDYLKSINFITSLGGFVVRLGDDSMEKLGSISNVFDYANSSIKSEEMDLYFISQSKFIIGTTSGLTTVASTFNKPLLLLNCISNDWQIWPKNTRFMLKSVWSKKSNQYLTDKGKTKFPTRGYFINALRMHIEKLYAFDLRPDEILKATEHFVNLLNPQGEKIFHDNNLTEYTNVLSKFENEKAATLDTFGAAIPIAAHYSTKTSIKAEDIL